jgi:hypothetical protein
LDKSLIGLQHEIVVISSIISLRLFVSQCRPTTDHINDVINSMKMSLLMGKGMKFFAIAVIE